MDNKIIIARQLETQGKGILFRVLIHSPDISLKTSVNTLKNNWTWMISVSTILYKGKPILECFWHGARDSSWDAVHEDAPNVQILEELLNWGVEHFISNPKVYDVDLTTCTSRQLTDIEYSKT